MLNQERKPLLGPVSSTVVLVVFFVGWTVLDLPIRAVRWVLAH